MDTFRRTNAGTRSSIMPHAVPFLALALCMAGWGADYYVDNSYAVNGNGTAMTQAGVAGGVGAWNSLDAVNAFNGTTGFSAGDNIYLKRGTGANYTATVVQRTTGGKTFRGTLSPRGTGAPGNPITIGAYDVGNAPVIDGGGGNNSAGVLLIDQEHWVVRDLEVTNSAATDDYRYGILVYFSPSAANTVNRGITIRDNHVHDVDGIVAKTGGMYYTGGIYIWAAASPTAAPFNPSTTAPNSRAADVLIEGNVVEDIRGEGIYFRGESPWDQHPSGDAMNWNNLSTDVRVRGNTVTNVCDGIVTMGVDDVLMENNIVDRAGGTGSYGTNTSVNTKAVCGLWTQCSKDGIVQFNEVMRTVMLPGDGQGYHTDIIQAGTCIFQYNYSHDNEGGFFTETWSETDDGMPEPRTIVRYNISENDGAGGASNALTMMMNLGRGEIYNNTIYSTGEIEVRLLDATARANHPPYSGGPNAFRNNVFSSLNPDPQWGDDIYLSGAALNSYENNCYTTNLTIPSGDFGAIVADPQLRDAGNAGDGRASASAYRLQPSSPCINAGLDIASRGSRDFFGAGLYNGNPDIGAYEVPNLAPILGLLLLD